MKTITEAINNAPPEAIDGMWAILKYRDIGVLRKLNAMSALLDLDLDQVSEEAQKDEQGRILDKPTRQAIHTVLLEASQQFFED